MADFFRILIGFLAWAAFFGMLFGTGKRKIYMCVWLAMLIVGSTLYGDDDGSTAPTDGQLIETYSIT